MRQSTANAQNQKPNQIRIKPKNGQLLNGIIKSEKLNNNQIKEQIEIQTLEQCQESVLNPSQIDSESICQEIEDSIFSVSGVQQIKIEQESELKENELKNQQKLCIKKSHQLDSLDTQIKFYESKYQFVPLQKNPFEKNSSQLNIQVKEQQQIQECKSDQIYNQDFINSLIQENKKKEDNLKFLNSENYQLKVKIEKQAKQLQQQIQKETTCKLEKQNEEIKEQALTIQQQQERLAKLEQNTNILEQKAKENQEGIQKNNIIYKSLDDQILLNMQLQDNLNQKSKELLTAYELQNKDKKSIENLNQVVQENAKEMENQKSAIKQFEIENIKQNEKIENLKNQLKESEDLLNFLNKKLQGKKIEIQQFEEKMKKIELEQSNFKDQKAILDSQIQKQNQVIHQNENEKSKLQNEIVTMKKKNDDKVIEQAEIIRKENQEAIQKNNLIQKSLDDQTLINIQLEDNLNQKSKELMIAYELQNTDKNSIANLNQVVQENVKEIEKQKSTIKYFETENIKKNEKIEDLKNQLQESQVQFNDLNKEFQDKKIEIQQFLKKMKKIENEQRNLEEQKAILDSQIQKQNQVIQQNENEKSKLHNEIVTIKKQNDELIQYQQIFSNHNPFQKKQQQDQQQIQNPNILLQEKLNKFAYISIYFSCLRYPKCQYQQLEHPFIHMVCKKKARFHVDGKISCKGKCENYHIFDAVFFCNKHQVCSKYDSQGQALPEKIQSFYEFSQFVQESLYKSNYSEERRLMFSEIISEFPYYKKIMIK